MTKKSLHNSDNNPAKDNVRDIQFYGDPETFLLIAKASSEEQGWMKSTKAMEIEGVGCVVQVTTQQGNNIAEAVTFVPGVHIDYIDSMQPELGRMLVASTAAKLVNDSKPGLN